MEKAVTALFNQLLLLFSIMQGINAEPLTEWDNYLRYNRIPGYRYLKASGFSSLLPYRLPNYSKSHPEHDYRRTLYWNPDLQLDENGEATIQFYNNGTCKKLHISGEGVSDDGRAIIVRE